MKLDLPAPGPNATVRAPMKKPARNQIYKSAFHRLPRVVKATAAIARQLPGKAEFTRRLAQFLSNNKKELGLL